MGTTLSEQIAQLKKGATNSNKKIAALETELKVYKELVDKLLGMIGGK